MIETTPKKTDHSVSMLKAQTVSLPFALFAIAEFFIFSAVWGFERVKEASDILLPWYFIPIIIVGIVVHELIHGITWKIAANLPFEKIKFGFQIKTLTPYAHCTIPITKRAYVIGTLMPAFIMGFVPFIISLVYGSGWILIIGILFTFAAVGDFLIVWLIRSVSWENLIEDHPENAGCFVYDSKKMDPVSEAESV